MTRIDIRHVGKHVYMCVRLSAGTMPVLILVTCAQLVSQKRTLHVARHSEYRSTGSRRHPVH